MSSCRVFFTLINNITTKVSQELNETLTLSDVILISISSLWGVIQLVTKSKWTLEFTLFFTLSSDTFEKEKIQSSDFMKKITSNDSVTASDLFWTKSL